MPGVKCLLAGLLASTALAGAAYADPPDIFPPQQPAGSTTTSISALSADGKVVVGPATISGVTANIYRWPIGGTSTNLGRAGGFTFNGVSAISADGSVLSDTSSSSGTPAHTFRWTETTGWVDLGHPDPIGSLTFGGVTATGISGDGTIIVGQTSLNSTRPFIWRLGSGFQVLDVLPTGFTGGGAQKISLDGSTVVGLLFGAATSNQRGFVWKNGTFTVIDVLPITGLTRSSARAVNRDGTVVAGDSQDNSGAGAQIAWRWTAAGGLQALGTLSDTDWSFSSAISGDGSRIVGQTGNNAGSLTYGFLWTSTNGMRSLDSVMAGLGIGTGWHLTSATGISEDGTVVIGSGRNPANQTSAYVLRLAAQSIATTSTSTSMTVTVVPVQNLSQAQTFHTTVNAILDGNTISTGDASGAFTSVAGQALVDTARADIQRAAGLRRVTFDTPFRTATNTSVIATNTTVSDAVTDSAPQQIGDFVAGPGSTILIGDLGICTFGGAAAQGSTPAQGPAGCAGGISTTLASNQTNTNTHFNIQRTITRTTNIAQTTLTEEAYAISASAGYQVGGVHQQVRPAGFDTGEWFLSSLYGARASARPFQQGGSMPLAWGEAYQDRAEFDGDTAGAARSSADENGVSIAGGLPFGEHFTGGVGASFGRSNIAVAATGFPERGDLDLTQAGAFLAGRWGGFAADFSATAGQGRVRTRVSGGGRAAYDVDVSGLAVRAAYEASLGDWRLTSEAGASQVRLSNDAFSETGTGLTIQAAGQNARRSRTWVAATLDRDIAGGGMTLSPELHVSVADVEDDGGLRAAFTTTPTNLSALSPGHLGHIETGVTAGLAITVSEKAELHFGYQNRRRGGESDNGVFASARLRW